MGSKHGSVVVGYRYYLGMHMIICHGPVDAVTGLNTEEYAVWRGNVTATGQVTINNRNLYGGKSREGGVAGLLDVEFGEAAQSANTYLESVLGEIPAFRGVVGLVSRQMYLGDNSYLKPWRICARRTNIDWQNTYAKIGDDMNPAHIIYNCLTDDEWGMGYLATDIDQTAFAAAAVALYNEGLGLSLLWDRSISIEDFIDEIKDQIDAVLYVERSNGLFTLKLQRDDYDVESLIELSPSNIIKVESYTRHTRAEMANTVTLKFVEHQEADDEDNAVTVHNIALIQSQGQIVPHVVNYPGISNATVASKVAARELRKVSTELAVVNLIANSAAKDLRPGSVFKFTWPKYGVTSEIMRVVAIDFGTMQNGQITIAALQDIYGTAEALYADVPASNWVNPVSEPVAVVNRRLEEMTYYEMIQVLGESEAAWAEIEDLGGFLMALYTQPSGDSIEYRMYTRPNSGSYTDKGRYGFTPTGTLAAAIGKTDTTATLENMRGIDSVFLDSYAYIDDELIQVTAVDSITGEMTLVRGILDTVPAEHLAAARVWFADQFYGTENVQKVDSEIVNVRACTITMLGELDLEDAATNNYTFDARMIRPYPPGKFLLNTASYPESITGELTIAWAHRDRLTQTGPIIAQSEGNIGPEDGTTYTIKIYGEADTLIRTYSGETGTSKVYPLADEITDSGLGRLNKSLRVTVTSMRDGFNSWQSQDHAIDARYVTVTYDGNGNTGGTAPVDLNEYLPDASVEIADKGTLTKTDNVFFSWNTQTDGSGDDYLPEDTFNIPSMITLYAQWGEPLSVAYDGNGNTGGTAPVDSNEYIPGDTVTVLGQATLEKSGAEFTNWNTQENGGGTSYNPAATFIMPSSSVVLYAQWTASARTDLKTEINTDGQISHEFNGMVPGVPSVSVSTGVIAEDLVSVPAQELSVPGVPSVSALTGVATFADAGEATISQASPGVVTKASHGLAANREVFFTTTGALPTGLTAFTHYYVKDPAENTFNVSAAAGGAAINTSSAGSGTHHLWTKD